MLSGTRYVRLRAWSGAVGAVLAATLVALPLRGRIDQSEIVMLYLLAIVLVATRTSRGPALAAALLSVGVFDFLFVPPYLTFAVADARYLPTFAMMLLVGVVIGSLTARVRLQAETAAAATLRARSEELRNALLSSVSHDLRTPLSAIKGAASALLEASGLDQKAHVELLITIREESERLERLVTNLLDMTRLESGGLVVRKQWVPLEEIVGSSLRRLERNLAGRGVTIDLPEDALVPLDDVLIENVIINLLENAARHTPAGTAIDLRAQVTPAQAAIEVADHGAGLAPGTEEKVFEKFWQGGTKAHQGSGLGLPICRGIVEAHGGRITAGNRPGGGAIFRIVLPIDAPPPGVPAERREDA